MSNRPRITSEFKDNVVPDAPRGVQANQEIVSRNNVHPNRGGASVSDRSFGEYFFYVLLFLLGAAPAVFLALTDVGAYNSPDETSRFMTAKTFVETGRLYFEDKITALNLDGPSGPRTTHQEDGIEIRLAITHVVLQPIHHGAGDFLASPDPYV